MEVVVAYFKLLTKQNKPSGSQSWRFQ